ncbi:uncharacterized protein LOC131954723 [Physella acuta]|uniref:uncharacterized protein LOC131954723 n=1 Tax=Physella acuta TaxID=109671 RepID=UPI0027DAFD98|nr:uncharacterized protein LOC131954723 [Physella acuta]
MAMVYGIIPTVYLIVCNFCLVYLYHRTKSGLLPSSKSLKIKKQILVIMLSSNFGAVFTLLPAAIFHTTAPYVLEYRRKSEVMKLQIVFQITVFLIYANNASNFLIYCCFSQRFRKKTVNILKYLATVFRREQTTDERSPSDMTSSQFFKEEGRTVSGANQQMEVKYIWSPNDDPPTKTELTPSPSHETPDQQNETFV